MEESQKYVVYTVFRNVEVKLGVFDTLADAYDCVRLVGKKTSRKFSIYSVKTEFLERITVHDINDDEITADSKVVMLEVDKDTCLYYRDLFVHKLGTTKAECYYLMLIDGKVTTAFGLHRRDFFSMKSNYIGEVFGISVSSQKYKRLGKLFMMCLTSGSFKEYLQSTMMMGARTLQGIKTSSKTSHHEGKTDRGVMKLIKREEQANGTFLVVYVGDFRQDTYSDCLKKWLKDYGYYKR